MGRPWVGSAGWDLVVEASDALGEDLGSLLLDGPETTLARTREAQLAVFLTSMLAWRALSERTGAPVAFAGHSLGQVTALVAAGALSVADGIRLAARRAEATQAAADARPGRLLALIGADMVAAEAVCDGVEGAWVANDNAPGQIVVGGTVEAIHAAAERAAGLGIRRTVALNVGGAFHTPLMAGSATALGEFLSTVTFSPPSAPVVCNVDGRAYSDASGWPRRLADQLVRPVRWRTCMATLESFHPDFLVEAGPGGVLAGLARRCCPSLPVRPVAEPADLAFLDAPAPVVAVGEMVAEVA